MSRPGRVGTVLVAGAFGLLATLLLPPVMPAHADEPIYGEGSTWSYPAILQWTADMANQGETINYNAVGSTAGRVAFYDKQADFAVSEIPFQSSYCTPSVPPVCTDEQQLVADSGRTYSYMPIVAGGTSIGYNLQINGQQFRKLRLSSYALAGIFTGAITYWDNPVIESENPGVPFPHIPVHPVGRSDGSGTSYQFSAYLAAMQPGLTHAYCARLGLPATCLPTSQWPITPGMTLQNGSDGVANYVTATYNNGAIGYAEYAYWIERNAPVVSVENEAGYFTQPTAVNVAVALTRALINPDHTQNLLKVYVNPDGRTYPISSYSYMIVPTNDVAPMDPGKGATLSKFILYFLCQGQQKAQPLGYSPLPPNLVQLGIGVNNLIPGGVHAGPATPSNCNNPTFHGFLQENDVGGGPLTRVAGIASGSGATGIGGPSGGPGGSNGLAGAGSDGQGPAAQARGAALRCTPAKTATLVRSVRSSSTSGTTVAPRSKRGSGRRVRPRAQCTTSAGVSGTGAGASGPGGQPVAVEVSAKSVGYGHSFSPSVPWWSILALVLLAAAVVTPPALALSRRRGGPH